ncbi:hypothetical protein POV27_17520 [Aureisphaera galaxeae]|uniref:hypothetical protein n=1 Tax=Aureisphaera galaxeae TaxID=1538023 RepID=UPI0023500C29|nr:hypothetical protein [Aureisphaera galaxeae]MDC8005857.1 hypothetical protein [Aureisphaera galaxeae]
MHKTLFLLCPTDCLEAKVNNTFRQENYFYTSLGNSFVSNLETLRSIKELIEKHNIRKISFVLSNDNEIILDALEGQFFSGVRGLETFYNEIMEQKEHSDLSWRTGDRQFALLSYYLNKRIRELRLQLCSFFRFPFEINGRIYDRYDDTFIAIYSDLICIEKYSLN